MRRENLLKYFAIGFVAVAAVVASVVAAPGLRGMLGAGLGLLMLAVSIIDARYFIIPNPLTAAALGLALVNAGLQEWETALQGVVDAVAAVTLKRLTK